MTSKSNSTILLERMSSVCADKSSLKARLAMISLFGDSSSSVLLDKILLFTEYLQLLSPILLFAVFFQQTSEESLPKTLLFLTKLINPGLWISFDELTGFKIFLLIVLLLLTLSKYLLFGWIIYKLRRSFEVENFVIGAWKSLFKVQGRVLHFYMTFFWVNFAMTSALSDNLTVQTRDGGKVIMSLFVIVLELAFTLIVNARYHYFLPMKKSFLSRKDNLVELITLVQKSVLQILTIFLSRDSLGNVWVITVVNITADLIRNFCFFRELPLYSFQALNYQAMILMGLTSINLACFVSVIGKSIDTDSVSLAFFLSIWAITAGLSIKISREYMKGMFWKVICDPSLKSPGLLIHRVPAIKELLRMTGAQFEWNEKSSWASLMNRTLNNHLKALLKVKEDLLKNAIDINNKDTAKVILKNYLEKLLESYPHNELLQLYTAQYSFQKFHKYGDAVKTVATLRQKGSGNVKLNAELLLIQIQNELQERAAERNRQSQIDITTYLQEQALVFQLQSSMLKQAKAQINVYSEVNKEVPDTQVIHENSQIFNTLRNKNIKTMERLLGSLSESNLEPLLLYAHYSYVLNHSYEDYSNYLKVYSQRLQKYQRYFDQEDLSSKNIFQNNTGLYFLSGNRANVAQIMFAPRSLGTRSATILDNISKSTIVTQLAPCLRGVYSQFYKYAAESNDETFFNKGIRGSIYHEDGYLLEVTYHLNIHPYVTQGFYFVLFLRPIISNRETLYVLENGDIDCGTKIISEKLGLLMKNNNVKVKKNINTISEELVMINKAFNMIAFPEKYKGQDLTMEQAKEIYEIFTTTGKEIQVSATIDNCTTSYPFHCKVVNRIYGSLLLKCVTLVENVKEAQKIINEYTFATSQRNRTPTKTEEKSLNHEETDDEDSFENFNDDEKEQGWIDFEPLTFRKNQTPLTKHEGDSNTDTARDQEETTSRGLLKTQISHIRTAEFAPRKKPMKLLPQKTGNFVKRTDNKRQTMVTTNNKNSEKASSLNESHSRASSQRRRLANLFKLSLEYNCSPRIFKGLSTLVYVSLFAFLLSQFIISVIVNTNVDSFKAQKDFLRKFQLRIFYLISSEGTTRLIHDVHFGEFNTTGLRTFSNGVGVYRNLATQYLTGLIETNQELLLNVQLFNSDLTSQLFDDDIPIYYTYFDESPQSLVRQTSFSAIDRIVAASVGVLTYNGTIAAEVQEAAQFVYRNSLNELLIKIQDLSEILIDFLNDRRSQIYSYVIEYFIVMVIINLLVFFVFIFFIWRQYLKEARNLSAFCKVNGPGMTEVLKSCLVFKEMIEEQKQFTPDLSQKGRHLTDKQAKREILKEYNHKGLRRKYYIHVGMYMIFLAALILFISATALLTTQVLDAFKAEQGQIYFLDSFRTRIALILQAARELIATNNAAFIENRPALEEFALLLAELKDVKTRIYSQLLDEETVRKIPEVKQMLLGDSCGLITVSTATFYCSLLADSGVENGLVYLLGSYEEVMMNYFNDYEASDKSSASLSDIQRTLYTEIPSLFVVMGNGALVLSDIIDGKLEEVLKVSNNRRFWFLFGCCSITLVGAVFLWALILRKLKRGIVEFKNVLKTLPAELVLSSFILKIFLRKTSKSGFETAFQN